MDDRQFDKITKALGSGSSRRSLLKRGGALVAGSLAAAAGLSSAQASHAGMCTFAGGRTTCVQEISRNCTTETTRTPTSQSCEVGNSGRRGTQQGNVVTTTRVCTITERTTVFRGRSEQQESQTTATRTERTVISSQFEATGRCRNIPGPQ